MAPAENNRSSNRIIIININIDTIACLTWILLFKSSLSIKVLYIPQIIIIFIYIRTIFYWILPFTWFSYFDSSQIGIPISNIWCLENIIITIQIISTTGTIITKRIVGLKRGIIILKNLVIDEAPSISAASITLELIFPSPERRIIVL